MTGRPLPVRGGPLVHAVLDRSRVRLWLSCEANSRALGDVGGDEENTSNACDCMLGNRDDVIKYQKPLTGWFAVSIGIAIVSNNTVCPTTKARPCKSDETSLMRLLSCASGFV